MTAHRRHSRPVLAAATAVAIMVATATAPAAARPVGDYTVNACEAAADSKRSDSWTPQPGSIDAYKACPPSSLTDGFGGMGTRLAGRTFRNGEFSRLWFFAPAGTTIKGMAWAGAYSQACGSAWSNGIRALGGADTTLFGTRTDPFLCFDAGPAAPRYASAPGGTTRLLQNTQCAQATCASGAVFRTQSAQVVIHDPTPPSLEITGGGLSGRTGWVRGRQALVVSAGDTTGIKLVQMSIAGGGPGATSPKSCDYAITTPCVAGNGTTNLSVSTADWPDGAHPVTVAAYDAGDNVTTRGATVKIDNHAPPAPSPALDGAPRWRSTNSYTLRWSLPEGAGPGRAPLTAARYAICPAGSTAGCSTKTVSEASPTAVAVQVPADGEWDARVALVDSAGNGAGSDAAWSPPVSLRLDSQAGPLRARLVKKVRKRGRRGKQRTVTRLVKSRRVGYRRRFAVRGRLLDRAGQPRPNTTITVYGRPRQTGATATPVATLRTDADGRFRYRARARDSRSLRFEHRASSGAVAVRVRARVSFRPRPRSVINGEAVSLRGRVHGRIPPGGKQVAIQAYARGKWRTFKVLRTRGRRGRFRYVYRFDGTRGVVTYPLRVIATKEPTFAYDRGASKVRRVTVRGL